MRHSAALDSAKVVDNKFTFRRKAGKGYEPYLVTLQAENPQGYAYMPFFLCNDKDSLNATHTERNLIYLLKGKTIITGDYKNRYLVMHSGQDNDFQFLDPTPLGFMFWDENVDSVSRKTDLEKAKSFIKSNPTSFYYLDKINSSRVNFSSTELKQLLSRFDKKVQRTEKVRELKAYSEFKRKEILSYSNFQLYDSSNHSEDVLDSTAQVTIISFWASWCGPCKAEIPVLKKIYEQYHDKGVRILSVSTDKSEPDWKKALNALQMPWT